MSDLFGNLELGFSHVADHVKSNEVIVRGFLYEPPHEKINVLHTLCENNGTDQHLWFRYTYSTIPLLSKSKI